GILLGPSSQLQSFGHSCDEECRRAAQGWARGHEEAPSLFQVGSSMQPGKSVDTETGAALKTQHSMTEIFEEQQEKGNTSLLQLRPTGAPQRETEDQVMAAMKEAVESLQARRTNGSVVDAEAAVDTVLDALQDGVGAQDPTFNTNGTAQVVEDPVLAALEDGVGAMEPSAGRSQAKPSNSSQAPAEAAVPETKSIAQQVAAGRVPERGFWSTRSGALAAAVGFVAATWLGVICLAAGFWMAIFSGWRSDGKGNLRATVEALRRCGAADLERIMPPSAGYDCAFSKPVSSRQLLRLEVRVEGPLGAALKAPLTGRSCVLHSAAVSKQLHDGMPPVPMAFSASNVDFVVSLLDNKNTRIHVKGSDVSLFDTMGKCVERTTFDAAPDSWQDFVLTHRSAAPQGAEWGSSSFRADEATLEFQEAALPVGAAVTVVGELHRGADGKLSLRPWQGEEKKLREPWRTSWERGCEDKLSRRAPDALKQKVFISDDEKLLQREPEVDGTLARQAVHSASCGNAPAASAASWAEAPGADWGNGFSDARAPMPTSEKRVPQLHSSSQRGTEPMELRVNPDGCQRFEANIFRRERCKHCGHPWHAHLGAIDADQLARFQSSRASGGGGSGSGPSGKAKAKPKAAPRAEWLFEDADEGGSGSDGEFRMLAGEDLELVARPRSSSSSVKIVNLVDFGECNPPTREGRLATSAAPGFTMPMRSKGDVLLEEVHFLRQMLADSNEEKRIQVAIVRDEVAEKQRVIDELRHQAAVAEARLQALRTSGEVVHVVSVRGSLQGWEEAKQQAACLKQRCDELEAAGKQQEAEVVRLKGKLDFWEASEESLADLSSEHAAQSVEGRRALLRIGPDQLPQDGSNGRNDMLLGLQAGFLHVFASEGCKLAASSAGARLKRAGKLCLKTSFIDCNGSCFLGRVVL
ncbi:unnamed protein product, partial [Effrenium voratum]